MHGPLPVADIIERIADQVPALKLIDTCVTIEDAVNMVPATLPALFIVRTEAALPVNDDDYTGGTVHQRVRSTIACVLIAAHAAEARTGAAAKRRADLIQAQLRAALVGWQPPGFEAADQPLLFRASRDEARQGNRIVVQDVFDITYDITTEI